MANRKRAPFNAAGPFRARRNKPLGDVLLEDGKVYDASLFASINPRKIEALYEAHWLDMAPDAADDEITTAEDLIDDEDAKSALRGTPGNPLDRDGDGNPGGSLSDAEEAALLGVGYTVEAFLSLPQDERDMTLSAAMLKASADENPVVAPETAQAEPPAGEPAADTAEGAGTPVAAEIAGYQHFGFGKYFPVDAEGNKIGDKPVSKTAAEGLAAQARVPVLPQAAKD